MIDVEAADPAQTEDLELVAYEVWPGGGLPLRPAPPTRDWMNATPRGFAKRCLPLLVANSWGWQATLRGRVIAVWLGGDAPEDLVVLQEDPQNRPPVAVSHFGSGVVTFHPGYLFRTAPGWDLLFTEPVNGGKDGLRGLAGIVETSWSPATATMNWRFTRPGQAVAWEVDEPIAQIVPVRTRDLARFAPEVRALDEAPALAAAHRQWAASRAAFNTDPARDAKAWQADYTRGDVAGVRAEEHVTRLKLRPFAVRG